MKERNWGRGGSMQMTLLQQGVNRSTAFNPSQRGARRPISI